MAKTSSRALSRAQTARRGVWFVALAATAWGTAGASAAVLYRTSGLGPVAVCFWRFALAVLLLAAARPVLRPGRFRGGQPWLVVATGAGLALSQAAYFAAVRLAGVATSTVITLGAGPALIAVAARYTLGERLGRRGVGTVAAAVAGVVLLAKPGTGGGAAPLLGTGFALLSALGYAGVTLLRRLATRPGRGGGEAYDTTLAAFAVGTCCLLPLAAAGGLWPHAHAALAFGLLGYLGAVPTAISYVLFFAGLRTVRAATASVVALLEAVTAALLGVVAMRERLGVPAVAGAVLLLVCVVSLSLVEPTGGGTPVGASPRTAANRPAALPASRSAVPGRTNR